MARFYNGAKGTDKGETERNETLVLDEETGHTEKSIDHVDPIDKSSKNLKRAIFSVVILMILCVISTLIVFTVVSKHKHKHKLSQKGSTTADQNDDHGTVTLIDSDAPYIPPPDGWEPNWTTTSTIAPEKNFTLDDKSGIETENDKGHNVDELIAQDTIYIPPSGNSSTWEEPTIEIESDTGDRRLQRIP